jgi:hypothetical protein
MKTTPVGKMAFRHTYRNAQGRQRWLHLGCFPRLSVEAARKSVQIHHGREIEGQPHTKVGTIQRYQHYAFNRKKRAVLARWETTLLAIREGQRAKVVQFPG